MARLIQSLLIIVVFAMPIYTLAVFTGLAERWTHFDRWALFLVFVAFKLLIDLDSQQVRNAAKCAQVAVRALRSPENMFIALAALIFLLAVRLIGQFPQSELLLFVSVCLMSPIWEEVIFRKDVIDNLSGTNVLLLCLVSTVIYATFHGLEAFLFSFLFGSLMFGLYFFTRRIWINVLLHSTLNYLVYFGGVISLT